MYLPRLRPALLLYSGVLSVIPPCFNSLRGPVSREPILGLRKGQEGGRGGIYRCVEFLRQDCYLTYPLFLIETLKHVGLWFPIFW